MLTGKTGESCFSDFFPKLELRSPITPIPLVLELWDFVFRYTITCFQSMRELKICTQPQLAKSFFEIGRKSRNIACVSHKGDDNGRNLKRSLWAKYWLSDVHIFWDAYPCEGLRLRNALRLIEMPTKEPGFYIYRGVRSDFFQIFFFLRQNITRTYQSLWSYFCSKQIRCEFRKPKMTPSCPKWAKTVFELTKWAKLEKVSVS